MNKLTNAEEEIMQYFWREGPSTISNLIDMMEDPKPPHSTISSIARILEKKGYLGHKSYGRTYEYFAVIDQKAYKKYSLRRLTGSYFNGSVEQLLSFLVKEEKIEPEDLKKLIENLENENS